MVAAGSFQLATAEGPCGSLLAKAPDPTPVAGRGVCRQILKVGAYNPFEPDLPTNSPKAHYAVTELALDVVRRYGTKGWASAVDRFRREQGALLERYAKNRNRSLIPVRLLDGRELQLSPGRHNEVQRAIVEEFGPRFAPGAHLLYLGDTAKKDLLVDSVRLSELGIRITDHDGDVPPNVEKCEIGIV